MEIKHLFSKRDLAKKSNMTFHNMTTRIMIMNMIINYILTLY